MNTEEISAMVMETLAHAVARDADAAARGLQALGENTNATQMYGVCCSLAEAGTWALKRIYGDRVPDLAIGDMWAIEEMKPGALADDPCKAFAVRFLIAYANEDHDSTLALYGASLNADSNGDQHVGSVCALLADVAGIARLAMEKGGAA